MTGLSVVIPTHNRRALLERAVASAEREGAEVVVVDDASTDDTGDYLDRAADGGVLVERLAVNGGPGRARNAGILRCRRPLILFLDDDDELRPGAAAAIAGVARDWPQAVLYLHNCAFPDGSTTIPVETPPTPLSYPDWIRGRFAGELKPVCRRELFDRHWYEDTGAGGEGLLWGTVIRESGAIVAGIPVVDYNDVGTERLTSAANLLVRSSQNARIAERWLEEFGDDLRAADPEAWRRRVLAAATYHLTAGDPRAARRFADQPGMGRGSARAVAVLGRMPRSLVRALFLIHRREILATVREGRLQSALGAVRPRTT